MMILLFSTFVSWYEGSAIIDHPWEWEYSTPFTQLNGEIQNGNQISQLDYFVYAAKFHPTFPLVMLISFLYLLILVSFQVLNTKHFIYFLSFVAASLFFLSYLVSNSSTIGGNVFFYFSMLTGIVCIATTICMKFLGSKRETTA